jgi:HEAT repeat protein
MFSQWQKTLKTNIRYIQILLWRFENTKDEEIEEMVKKLEAKRQGLFRKTRRFEEKEEEKYMDPLIKALEGDDENLRKLAEIALGTSGPPISGRSQEDLKNGINYIQKLAHVALKSEKGLVKTAGEEKKFLQSLIEDLKTEDPEDRHEIILTLGNMGSDAIEPLIKALNDEDWIIRAGSTLALGMIGESSVEPLIQAMKSEDWDRRRRAAQALGWIGDKQAIPALIKALKDENDHVRMGAADAIANIGDSKGKAALSKYLKESSLK